jgi:hypothetical protein
MISDLFVAYFIILYTNLQGYRFQKLVDNINITIVGIIKGENEKSPMIQIRVHSLIFIMCLGSKHGKLAHVPCNLNEK